MDKEELFIKASRKKIRFSYKGLATTEDLWDLPVTELDGIYKSLNAKAKLTKEESLLETKTDGDEELMLQIEIIKYIVSVKLEEKKEAEKAQRAEAENHVDSCKQAGRGAAGQVGGRASEDVRRIGMKGANRQKKGRLRALTKCHRLLLRNICFRNQRKQ